MKPLPLSVPHSIAGHYHNDAREFAARFDILWESELQKTGRIKSFVDLMLACECALKCHAFLGRLDQDPYETYRLARRAGHRIEQLVRLAIFLDNRSIYEQVGSKLAPFSVLVRYSLDAYATFFPSLADWGDALIEHRTTVGSNTWVLGVRSDVGQLINLASPEFAGVVSDNVDALLQHDQEMKEFMIRVAPNKSFKPKPLRGSA